MRHHVKASRRLVSLLLSVVMVLGLLTPGFAAGSGALSLTEGNPTQAMTPTCPVKSLDLPSRPK